MSSKHSKYQIETPEWLWELFGETVPKNRTFNERIQDLVAEDTLDRLDGELDDEDRQRINQFLEGTNV